MRSEGSKGSLVESALPTAGPSTPLCCAQDDSSDFGKELRAVRA
jgi:hypothetical protein